ncbi:MAG: hypothetical protein DRK00_07950, partial [Thermoprotei archaeon]
PLDEEWVLRRVGNVTSFVEEAGDLVKERGIELSAAVFADYPGCVVEVGQDWVDWCERGLLDWVAPMTYTNITLLVQRYTRIHRALVKTTLYEGLGKRSSMSQLSPKKLLEQAKTALRERADGVIAFCLSGMTEEDFKLLKELKAIE